jgi:hypothetical protein
MPDFREALAEYNRAGFVQSAMFAVTRDSDFQLVEFDCVMVRNPD